MTPMRMLLCVACLALMLSLAMGQDEHADVDDWHQRNGQLAGELARDLRMTVARDQLEARLAQAKLSLDLEHARVEWEVSLTGSLSHLSALAEPEAGNWSQYTNELSNKTYRYTNACQQAVQEYQNSRSQSRSSRYYDRTSEFSRDVQWALSRLQRRGGGMVPAGGGGEAAPVIVDLVPVFLEAGPSQAEDQARSAYEQALAGAWQTYEQALAEQRQTYREAMQAATDAHNAGQQTREELVSALRRAARVYESDSLDAYDDLRSTAMKELRRFILTAEE